MPLALLGGEIFRRLLERHSSLSNMVRAWQGLALVCKAWRAALCESTPVCVELTKPSHLSVAARRWLSSVPVEALVLARTVGTLDAADHDLLAGDAFQSRSAGVLRSLMHVSPGSLPLLHTFSRLKQVRRHSWWPAARDCLSVCVAVHAGSKPPSLAAQVALFCDSSNPLRRIEPAVFHELPKLNCLTLAGHWGALDTAELPTRLKHLALRCGWQKPSCLGPFLARSPGPSLRVQHVQ